MTGVTSLSGLLASHGRGRGCDICKPAVASILASQLGEHVLAGELGSLQDTNDHLLANMQRNGTYSVVPRIPGGEITPDGLIAIGQVAKEFGLYTKITGGQRIDLFGARAEQLPLIWTKLVDAGFESGHAYGKALRTVKSCVGSTWCRFGVQDSVGMAVALELRYRGLRAPHKLKSGVSGCARECAEAQGKDFGIIATEKGWNLYVGGNGGATPKHAIELARDLDDVTLIRYIDRFLMFYIRTADRLQRTAPWLDALDGGIDYLRSVIIDDSLGICAELEDAMARHVGGYVDEWAATHRGRREAQALRLLRQRTRRARPRRSPSSTSAARSGPRSRARPASRASSPVRPCAWGRRDERRRRRRPGRLGDGAADGPADPGCAVDRRHRGGRLARRGRGSGPRRGSRRRGLQDPRGRDLRRLQPRPRHAARP